MPDALWLLLGLQLRGWLRYLGRSLRTVRGALLAVVGLTVFVSWLLMLLVRPSGGGIAPEDLRRYAVALHVAGPPSAWEPRELAEQALKSPAWVAVSAPLGWFFELWLAREVWPGLVGYGLLGAGVDLALAGLVLALDTQYLEAAAAS